MEDRTDNQVSVTILRPDFGSFLPLLHEAGGEIRSAALIGECFRLVLRFAQVEDAEKFVEGVHELKMLAPEAVCGCISR